MDQYTQGSQLTAVFVAEGAFSHPDFKDAYAAFPHDGIEFADRLSHAACLIENVWQANFANSGDGVDFVWEYEVSFPLGRWLIDEIYRYKEFPSDDAITTRVEQLAIDAEAR